jgi:hypothetical protein
MADKAPMLLDKWETKLILRLRALQNIAERGIIAVVWNARQIGVVSPEKGMEILVTRKKP